MLRDIRKQYQFSALTEDNASEDPFIQFDQWLSEAVNGDEAEPTAMVLSTVDVYMQPHSRVVLLKEFSKDGFVFFTNYNGNKSLQMFSNAKVSLLFFWQSHERQVRITGVVEKNDASASDNYFYSRPVDSRLGAWASPQSSPVESYSVLTQRFEEFKVKFQDQIPRPPHWGGFVVKPTSFEFWQGRPNRLHDRLFYSKLSDEWKIERLAP